MTVRELIIQLENCNPDAEVYILYRRYKPDDY